MTRPRIIAALAVLSLVPPPAVLVAQGAVPRRSRLEGKWQARGPDEAIHYIMVRGDSSAQFGDQVARWPVVGDSLWLTLGDGVWMVYGMKLEGGGGGEQRLTLSGGDLEKPVTLRRLGPATVRPDSLAIPEAPPASARA